MGKAGERFAGLDLMRGFAALAVLSLHIPHAPGASPVLPRAYLAVDFFFALSGFVLAHAYGARLANDLGPLDFLRIRLRRLYPLYLCALVAGAILMLGDAVLDAEPARFVGDWAGALVANLLFLPAPPPFAGAEGLLFPAVGASWSLFWELAANLLYAVLARLAPRAVFVVAPLALLVLAALPAHPTLDGGAHWADLALGGLRVCWAFFLGVMLQRFVRPGETAGRDSPVVAWAAALFMIALFALRPPAAWIGAYDLLFVTVFVPVLIVTGARARLGGRNLRVASWLGGISYAVYILQSPVLKMLKTLASAAGASLAGMGLLWASGIFVGTTLLIAQLFQSRPALQSRKVTTTSPAAR